MEEKKFEEMMDDWASRELTSVPKLQPTAEMYAAVKARKKPLFFPVFARWATIGAAAAAMLIATLMYPHWFRSQQALQETIPPAPPVEQPAAADQKAQNEKVAMPVAMEAPESEKVVVAVGEEKIADKGMMPPEIAPPAPAQEPAMKPLAEERRESSGNREETVEKKADATLQAGRVKDEAVAESALQDADSSTRGLEVLIAPAKEKAASPKICAVQPVGTSALQESDAMLSGKAMTNTPKSSFEGQASELMSEVQRGVVAQCQQIGEKTFILENDVWVDSEHTPEKTIIAIQRESEAYRKALELRPELKPYFDAWERVIVNLGDYSLEMSAQGKTALSEEDIARLKK